MADDHGKRKLFTYRALYRLNRAFARVVRNLNQLYTAQIFRDDIEGQPVRSAKRPGRNPGRDQSPADAKPAQHGAWRRETPGPHRGDGAACPRTALRTGRRRWLRHGDSAQSRAQKITPQENRAQSDERARKIGAFLNQMFQPAAARRVLCLSLAGKTA